MPPSEFLSTELEEAYERMTQISRKLVELQLQCKVDVNESEALQDILNPGIMHIARLWAMGEEFSRICELTDQQEGTVVRLIMRIFSVCEEIRNAARVIGDGRLYEKMDGAAETVKRDIVFAASLYVDNM